MAIQPSPSEHNDLQRNPTPQTPNLLPDPVLPAVTRPLAIVGGRTYAAIWPYVRRDDAKEFASCELIFVRYDDDVDDDPDDDNRGESTGDETATGAAGGSGTSVSRVPQSAMTADDYEKALKEDRAWRDSLIPGASGGSGAVIKLSHEPEPPLIRPADLLRLSHAYSEPMPNYLGQILAAYLAAPMQPNEAPP